MAYANACVAAGFTDCTRLQYWSNPANTFGGFAMGNSVSRNYQVLNNTAVAVANFRTQVVGDDFSSNFNGSSAGWTPVIGGWALVSSAYYRSAGVANLGSSAKHLGFYGDLTYSVRMRRTGACTSCANRIIIRGKPTSLDPTKWWKPSYVFQYGNDGFVLRLLYERCGNCRSVEGMDNKRSDYPRVAGIR